MGIKRWDLFLEEMPAYVWDGWESWMSRNPDHPAHRDQLACNLAAMPMQMEGSKVKPEDLMRIRLGRPWMPGDEE